MGEGRFVRLQDVAEHANVSLATASRVLNGGGNRGRAELRERVIAAASELGYVPNPHAQALASSTSEAVALLVHDIRDSYFAQIASGAINAANSHERLVTIAASYRDPYLEMKYISMLRAQRVGAIILTASAYDDPTTTRLMREELQAYHDAGGAVVSITSHDVPGDSILIDNYANARKLAERLVEVGHSSFGIIAGPQRLVTIRDRVAGFTEGLRRAGIELDPEFILRGEFNREGGYNAATRLAGSRDRPACVFAANDVMALGALVAFRDAGVSVPKDIAIAGFGDIPLARDSTPTLSTVQLPLEEIGAEAMRLALHPDRSRFVQRRVEAPGDVIVLRESTAYVRPD